MGRSLYQLCILYICDAIAPPLAPPLLRVPSIFALRAVCLSTQYTNSTYIYIVYIAYILLPHPNSGFECCGDDKDFITISITPTLPSEADYAQDLRKAPEDAAQSAHLLAHLG